MDPFLTFVTLAICFHSSSCQDIGMENATIDYEDYDRDMGIMNVSTVLIAPYMMKTPSGEYYGFLMDILNRLGLETGWDINVIESGTYEQEVENEWSGVMGDVLSGVTQLAAAPMGLPKVKNPDVYYTEPFMEVMLSVVFQCNSNINNITDLVNDPDMNYTISRSNPLLALMENTDGDMYKAYSTIKYAKNYLMTTTDDEGVDRVRNEPNFAFFVDSGMAHWVTANRTDCWLQTIMEPNIVRNYVFASRRDWTDANFIGLTMQALANENFFQDLSRKWWGDNLCNGKCYPKTTPGPSLTTPIEEMSADSTRLYAEIHFQLIFLTILSIGLLL